MPITININSGSDFEPVSEGVHAAVLADVVDLGVVPTSFGNKHKVQFIWLTDEADKEGRTKYVFQRFTASLHEKSGLRKAIKGFTKRDIPADLKSFDIESLIGTQTALVIQHNEAPDGKIYANVTGYMRPSAKVTIPGDFVRRKDRPANSGGFDKGARKPVQSAGGGRAVAAAVLAPPASQPIGDDDIPF